MSSFGFEILPLTPDEDDSNYNSVDDEPNDDPAACSWMDDSECQENLFQIVPLMPEETVIDADNHIHTHFKLFFEELGYLTEEPEPIDPTRDYDAEARQLLAERDRTRQKHINVSRMPSLSYSGVSSTSSSFHHQDCDVRSPLYMGHVGGGMDHHHHHHHHVPYHTHHLTPQYVHSPYSPHDCESQHHHYHRNRPHVPHA